MQGLLTKFRLIARTRLAASQKRKQRKRLFETVEHVSGPLEIDKGPDDVIVFSVMRNEAHQLPSFLDHHRRLGVRHFAFLDNGSTDGSLELVRDDRDVTVVRSALPFKSYKEVFRRHLQERFVRDGWGLRLDVDERFDYPGSGRISLRELIAYLESNDYAAVLTQMLDLFSDEPVGQAVERSENPATDHRFYDVSAIEMKEYAYTWNELPDVPLRLHYGGIRASAFGTEEIALSKHALRKGSSPSPHRPRLGGGARIADFSAVLLHYKFFGDFRSRVDQAVEEGQYYLDSMEYRHYLEGLKKGGSTTLMSKTSEEFTSADALLESGFLVASDRYRELGE